MDRSNVHNAVKSPRVLGSSMLTTIIFKKKKKKKKRHIRSKEGKRGWAVRSEVLVESGRRWNLCTE